MLIQDPTTQKSEPLDFQKHNLYLKQERLRLQQLLDDVSVVWVYVCVYTWIVAIHLKDLGV